MFGLFKKSNDSFEPLNYESRKYFENNLLCLHQDFPEPSIDKRKVFTPTIEDFPISWNGSEDNAHAAIKIIAENMQIRYDELDINFYDNGIKEINMGMSSIFIESDPENPEAAGLYHGMNDNNQFAVSFDKALLNNPDNLIATIAHELAHVKLLGHRKLDFNDENLTDMTTVFYGFGIFNANTSFQFQQSSDRWSYSTTGYLKQEEWAYVLALFAFIRYEENPNWAKFLNKTIKKDFEKSLKYMHRNENEIFRIDDE